MSLEATQRTIQRPCTVSGRGYWSGKLNRLTFLPAPKNHGIQFVRKDVEHSRPVRAVASNSIGMAMRTRLTDGMVEFDMIEHVMSALYGLGIHNVLVECTAGEMPGFDGSSFPIALALSSVGYEEQGEPLVSCTLKDPIEVSAEDSFARFEPEPNGEQLRIEYQLDYGHNSPIGIHCFSGPLSPQTYLEQIAPARTFVTAEEAERLQASGIAQHVTERDLLVFGANGPIDNELRFANECARHKALDLVGDLALTGINLLGKLIARKSGHQMNGELARLVQQKFEESGFATKRVA